MHMAKGLLNILGDAGSLVAAIIAVCSVWMARGTKKRSNDNP